MDTDDLSERAYGIIAQAARVCDTLKAELGALSMECKNESEWLEGVQNRLMRIVDDPDGQRLERRRKGATRTLRSFLS